MKIENVWQGWTVESKLGQGAFGTVYKCFKEEYGRRRYAAVKVISFPGTLAEELSDGSATGEAQTRVYCKDLMQDCLREIRIMESLKDHPNIVHIEDYRLIETEAPQEWQLFIRMELLTPFKAYAYDRTFTEEDVIRLAGDIANALKACAKKNIVHRDIKPENIFVDGSGNFKLGDFGVAKHLSHTQTILSRKGTFNYMAPEVLSAQKGDSRADIYSLGILMYQLLNNQRLPFLDPFQPFVSYAEREEAFKRRTVDGEALPILPKVSGRLNAVILRATQFHQEDRYKTIDAFLDALKFQHEKGRKQLMPKIKQRLAGLIAVFLLLVSGIGGFFTYAKGTAQVSVNQSVVFPQGETDGAKKTAKKTATIKNSGHINGVYSVNGVDYFATNDGFFKYDGKKKVCLINKPCVSEFSIINNKIYVAVIKKVEKKRTYYLDSYVNLSLAQCTCRVMNLDGSGQKDLFSFTGGGYVVGIVGGNIYYLDDVKDFNFLAGTGRTLYRYSTATGKKTKIHENADEALLVNDRYLFFNEYTGGGDYNGSKSFRYDCKTGKIMKLGVKIASCNADDDHYGHMAQIDKNTLLLFYTKMEKIKKGEYQFKTYLATYDIAANKATTIKAGAGTIVDVIDSHTLGLRIWNKGFYLYDCKTGKLTLFTKEEGYEARFLNKETLLLAYYDSEVDRMVLKKVSKDGSCSFRYINGFDFRLGHRVLLRRKTEESFLLYDNCDSVDGVLLLDTLKWKRK